MLAYPMNSTAAQLNLTTACSQEIISNILLSKPCIAIDLDETLVFSYQLPPKTECFPVRIGRRRAYVTVRPGAIEFLDKIKEMYEIFIFTASEKPYADKVIDAIAPYIDQEHRLFRDSCQCADGYHVKDLRILNRPLNRVLLVDDMCASALFQRSNLVRITPWMGEKDDTVLLQQLLPVLTHISKEFDIASTAMQLLSLIHI